MRRISSEDAISDFEFFNSKCDPSCIFEPYHVNSESLKIFPTMCATVCGYLLFDQNTDVTEENLTRIFQNIKTLYGFLNIKGSNFKSASFLGGLEVLECETTSDLLLIECNSEMLVIGMENLTSISCGIHIYANENMTKLGLPNLKVFGTNGAEKMELSIANSAHFCITVEEVTNIFSSAHNLTVHLYGAYCEFEAPKNIEVCEIQNFSLATFDPSCQRVFGAVIVKKGDEKLVQKMENLTWIYGELVINGTDLLSVDFLENLESVISLRDYAPKTQLFNTTYNPAIQIYNNPNLFDAEFPNLKNAISFHDPIKFDGNHESLVLDPKVCIKIKDTLNSSNYVPLIDDKTCGILKSEKLARDLAELERQRMETTTQGAYFLKLNVLVLLITLILCLEL